MVIVLSVGIWIGFLIGFSRAMRAVSVKLQTTKNRRVGPLFAGGGALFLLIAIGTAAYTVYFVHTALRAGGSVVEMQQTTDKDSGDVLYAPTFQFRDSAGVSHTVASTVYQSPPAFHVGDTVSVIYLANHPDSARINAYWDVWGFTTVFGILGVVFSAIGLGIIWGPKIRAQLMGRTVTRSV